jgi:CBS domain-containing protein
MEAELAEVRDFLRAHAPFDALPEATLARLPSRLSVRYFRRGTRILSCGEPNDALFVVRSGAVELRDAEGTLEARLGAGEVFGYPSLLSDGRAKTTVTALEDTLLYELPGGVFRTLIEQSEAFAQFFAEARTLRLQRALRGLHHSTELPLLNVRIADLALRPPVTVSPEVSVQRAAEVMYERLISSVVVVEEAAGGARVVGILTDRDLRGRVVAQGLPYSTPVREVMTPAPRTVEQGAYAFEALLTMTRFNIHHLPVVDGQRLLGMVSSTDLMRLQTSSPVYLVGDLLKQTTVAGLAEVSARLPETVRRLVEADATADQVGRLVTTVADTLEVRLLELAEAALGPPPAPYAWVVLGSRARFEATVGSDQDNALVLADEAAADRYFAELARFVSDGLAACGYPYCPGGVMATTPAWRQPLGAWRRRFRSWLERPEPEALLHSTIFFDMRTLRGEAALVETLQSEVATRAPQHGAFLAHLAKNALQKGPPLGFFRQFVLEGSGEHAHTLDLKHKGIAPIVDLARVYALAAGRREVSTRARLRAAAEVGALSAEGARDLEDALEFIAYLRLRHQGRQVRAGEAPDNFVAPEELSPFERRHLKDAFGIVRGMQSALATRFQTRFVA